MRFAWSKMASRRELSDAPASFAARHGRKQPETGREASETAPKPSILFDFQCFFSWTSMDFSSLGQLGAGHLGPPQLTGLEAGAQARHEGEVRLEQAGALGFKAWL